MEEEVITKETVPRFQGDTEGHRVEVITTEGDTITKIVVEGRDITTRGDIAEVVVVAEAEAAAVLTGLREGERDIAEAVRVAMEKEES